MLDALVAVVRSELSFQRPLICGTTEVYAFTPASVCLSSWRLTLIFKKKGLTYTIAGGNAITSRGQTVRIFKVVKPSTWINPPLQLSHVFPKQTHSPLTSQLWLRLITSRYNHSPRRLDWYQQLHPGHPLMLWVVLKREISASKRETSWKSLCTNSLKWVFALTTGQIFTFQLPGCPARPVCLGHLLLAYIYEQFIKPVIVILDSYKLTWLGLHTVPVNYGYMGIHTVLVGLLVQYLTAITNTDINCIDPLHLLP